MNVVLIDNLDSFSFNLVEAFERLGCTVQVLRNSVAASRALAIAEDAGALIAISPGPGRPEDSGCCLDLVRLARGRIPLLGICLGHQAIALEAGARVATAPEPVHGKSSLVEHDALGPFAGMPPMIRVGRYHSLCVRDLPGSFHVHATCGDLVMAFSHAEARQVGLQFHPESLLTGHGDQILRNALKMLRAGSIA